jgi:hypothetical protein
MSSLVIHCPENFFQLYQRQFEGREGANGARVGAFRWGVARGTWMGRALEYALQIKVATRLHRVVIDDCFLSEPLLSQLMVQLQWSEMATKRNFLCCL